MNIFTSLRKFQFLLVLLVSVFTTNAQDDQLEYNDQVYLDNIYSVQLYAGNLPLSEPIINLGRGILSFSFDDLDGDAKDYVYSFVHCNADWTPSELTEIDFLDGFNEEDIEDYNFSLNTVVPYTNYALRFPNEDTKFKVSGNYLLKIYDVEDEKTLAITRRFMVVDPIMQVGGNMTNPTKPGQFKTHHELDFEVIHKDIRIKNPQSEVKVVVRQNGRWDNAITDLKPLFTREERLIYDYQGKVVFPAGKEFRFLDIRTFRYMREKVAEIIETDEQFEVTIFKEKSRAFNNFSSQTDINGQFVIESLEDDNSNLRGDYAEVFFSLGLNLDIENADVYIIGKFCNWQLKKECRMVYNETVRAYVAKIFLKQGFYDYMYAVVPHNSKEINFEELEGNWYETENDYSVLVYYRPFGQRYDKLVAYSVFNSVNP